ncbi:hypothetical protein ACS5PU_17190 [Pedobacter sp. GSP4]|uniref:hypothetical protein n=1 Tax=Pedobacter sp. GSP4 TaxID=3453716 RepID=UPI003EEC14D3
MGETSENVSTKEAIIRGLLIVAAVPLFTVVDRTYSTALLIFIVPVLFYLEVTAFTIYSPVKAIFSNYRLPQQFD